MAPFLCLSETEIKGFLEGTWGKTCQKDFPHLSDRKRRYFAFYMQHLLCSIVQEFRRGKLSLDYTTPSSGSSTNSVLFSNHSKDNPEIVQEPAREETTREPLEEETTREPLEEETTREPLEEETTKGAP